MHTRALGRTIDGMVRHAASCASERAVLRPPGPERTGHRRRLRCRAAAAPAVGRSLYAGHGDHRLCLRDAERNARVCERSHDRLPDLSQRPRLCAEGMRRPLPLARGRRIPRAQDFARPFRPIVARTSVRRPRASGRGRIRAGPAPHAAGAKRLRSARVRALRRGAARCGRRHSSLRMPTWPRSSAAGSGSRRAPFARGAERAADRQGRRYSAACRAGGRTLARPSASAAWIVVRTMSRASCAGHGRPRCMVARLSHITTSPLRHACR